MAKLRVLVEHDNEFGERPRKAVGDEYEAPATVAQGLVANGYCAVVGDKAPARAKQEG